MEFAGTLIRADTIENEEVVSILPRDTRIKAFFDLKKTSTKKDIQVLCGMLSSLQALNPNIPLNVSMLRKVAGSRGKVTWNKELEEEYQNVMKIMQTRIRLSLYDQISVSPW